MLEQDLRKDGWVEGEWITLGDDQAWCLPKPVVFKAATRFKRRIEVGDGGAARLGMAIPIDSDPYFGMLARLLISEDVDYLNVLLNLAATLLKFNYNIDDDAIGDMLYFEHDEAGNQTVANRDMWSKIRDVAMGVGPKPTPVG